MSSSSPAAAASAPGGGVDAVINPEILFVVAVLAIVFFACGLLHLLVRHLLRAHRRRRRARAEDADGVTAFQGQLQELFHLHDGGVDQASIDALPVFVYKDVVGGDGAAAVGKDPFDCAVCLCEFDADDQLRLLPRCSHAFHLECIDTWLLSHSTCPLCRRSLLADLSPTCSSVVTVPESESFRDMADSGRPAGVDTAADVVEPGGAAEGAAEEVVQVKLGKFMCVEGDANAMAGAEDDDEEGTSSNVNGDGEARLGQRRCHSMGSYEYVMEERASLRVAIKPPPKKKKPAAVSKARRGGGAMSECQFGASKRGGGGGESSLRWPRFPTPAAQKHQQSTDVATAKLTKDSFSESKIWMVPPSTRAAAERRTASFRWPMSSKEDEPEGNNRRKSGGSEADWDVEEAGENSIVSSMAEERPSFARRTLLWVVGGRQQQSSRVGSCS